MKKIFPLILLISFLASIVPESIQAAPSVPAFPGAEGWGAQSVGGRGGQVIEVTNLNDAGPGSLRECAQETSGPRTCVFRVAGIIDLTSGALRVWYPYLTIAGQTAPGDGITIKRDRIIISTHNVIIRYLHWRGGGFSFVTIRAGNDAHDIIVDHCSASGGLDDIIDINYNTEDLSDPDIRDITIQNCLIAEAHAVHPTAIAIGGTLETNLRVHNISIHHNYLAHNGWRNPLIGSQHTEVVNNVVYNWADRIGGVGYSSDIDWINNYWKAGPMTYPPPWNTKALVFENIDTSTGNIFPLSSIYIAGNIAPSFGLTDPNKDNWFLFKTHNAQYGEGEPVPLTNRRLTALTPAPTPVTITPALSVFNSVVTNAGSNMRLNGDGTFTNNRDDVDQKFIDHFNSGTGLTDLPTVITQPSSIDPGTPYPDSDKDGMADEWENIHFGSLAVGSVTDSSSDNDGDGYTDLEEFLNGTDPKIAGAVPPPLPPPTPPPVVPGSDTAPPSGDEPTSPEEVSSFPITQVILVLLGIGVVVAVIVFVRKIRQA